MSPRQRTYRGVDELQAEFERHREAIRSRLDEFTAVRPRDYFYELAYCLLTPQSSAMHAAAAVDALKDADYFGRDIDAGPFLRRPDSYIRFHNTKARHLHEARAAFAGIAVHLENGTASAQLREWLTANVKGLGWKESSHFLRNIGHRNLAILDRHILRNLVRHAVIRSLPKTLTRKRYLSIEARFAEFASQAGITMDELDLLFWSRQTGRIFK